MFLTSFIGHRNIKIYKELDQNLVFDEPSLAIV